MSVDGFQESDAPVCVTFPAASPVGVDGGVVSDGGGGGGGGGDDEVPPTGVFMSVWICACVSAVL